MCEVKALGCSCTLIYWITLHAQTSPGYTVSGSGSAPPPYQPTASGGTTTTTVISQPVVLTNAVQFSDIPVQLRCPNCHRDVTTILDYTAGILTWIIVLVLIMFGMWLGCCLIPLCIDGVKDVNHVCPNCSYTIGKYKRL